MERVCFDDEQREGHTRDCSSSLRGREGGGRGEGGREGGREGEREDRKGVCELMV